MPIMKTRPDLTHDTLRMRYADALRRRGGTGAPVEVIDPPRSYDLRTCTSCGEFGWFKFDPDGGWARCEACGKEA